MAFVKSYLVAYNVIQFAGWCAIFATKRIDLLYIFQTIQVLEVLHCLLGFVKSSAFQTSMQILSRIVVVWVALVPFESTRESIGYPMILIAWPIAETTRYLYYTMNLVDLSSYIVTWARYSFFIVLYPLGVTGELLITWQLKNTLTETKSLDYPLPNKLNISIYGNAIVITIMLLYIPCKYKNRVIKSLCKFSINRWLFIEK